MKETRAEMLDLLLIRIGPVPNTIVTRLCNCVKIGLKSNLLQFIAPRAREETDEKKEEEEEKLHLKTGKGATRKKIRAIKFPFEAPIFMPYSLNCSVHSRSQSGQ